MTGYLLDTNCLSLFFNNRASAAFDEWVETQHADGRIFVSVISLQEIEKGGVKLGATKGGSQTKALDIGRWVRELSVRFAGRVLPVDMTVALVAGRIEGAAVARGHTPSLADVLIGATAEAFDLTVVTLNLRDFQALGVRCEAPL